MRSSGGGRWSLGGLCLAAALGCAGDPPRPEDPAGDATTADEGEGAATRPAPAESPLHRFTFDDLPSNRDTGERLQGGNEVELVAADGSRVHLSDYRGAPVVLVFNRGYVGAVCPYGATHTAQLAARYDEVRKLGAEVVVVYPTPDRDEAPRERFVAAVEEVLAAEGRAVLPFPVFLDPGLRATTRLDLIGDLTRPSTFVLDENGVVQYAHVGKDPHERPAVDRIVAELEALRR